MTRFLLIALAASLLLAATAAAFNGHVAKDGPLTVTIGEIADVTEYAVPREVIVTVKNSGDRPLKVQLKMAGLVDEWRAVGDTEAQVTVPAGQEAKATFRIASGEGALSAFYPVHIYATYLKDDRDPVTLHAVQVFKTDFKKPVASAPSQMPVNVVPEHGALSLVPLRTQRIAWCYFDKPLVYMPVGWEGSDPASSAHFSRSTTTRGGTKAAITMHPPWKPGAGTVFAEYLLKLPDTKPIEVVFSNAIRDQAATEPPSDGVTFRVWVGEEKLFEHHTASKVWVDGKADLSKFAGKEVLLRLESHPGPAHNTTCDSSFWGDPTVVTGAPPAQLTDAEREQLRERARKAVATATTAGTSDEFVFKLDGGTVAALVLGKNGLADAALAFGAGPRSVVFDGLQISVLRNKFGQWPSQIFIQKVDAKTDWFGRLRITHYASLDNDDFALIADVWKDKSGLRIKLASPKRITDIALGPADQKAPRVYYGHGYCIVEPQPFRAGFGGHNLSTSHVGFDFEKGVSLLTASDTPPDNLTVNPDERSYALHTHIDSTLTFVPSTAGALDCALKYRPLFDKKPAGGVKRKAGRFVFDIWGGKYAEIADTMKRMIAYGLTDSLLSVHVWQRWGYDYRLPDIYPPDPRYGTVEDMQQIAAVCTERDIPWGLHDNYIDFYPDAEDYTYEDICFTEDGRPIKAWINESRDAQSYRWRPDCIMPFVKRNLALVKPNLRPTHYFLDVFTSAGCFDFYDRQGNFHPSTETRKCWGEVFATIRDTLGDNAPTSSEAGHDQLIGYLDGADCQHMLLTPEPSRFGNYLACKDWERVPWFDAVSHARFILHGVGYSDRYQGGRTRRDHGIESDDYITSELLEGHALMIDRGAFGRGAVRKYWLAQDFIRSIALDAIEKVEFADGDMHRQTVTWKSGARVYVNRGEKDWTVAGRTLPMYGYFAKNGEIESSIERINGVIVEQSRGLSGFYVNARSFEPDPRLRIRPTADRVEYLGDRKFKTFVIWDAECPAPKDLNVFVHFDDPKRKLRNKLAFSTGGKPSPGTSAWKGRVATGKDWAPEAIPQDFTGTEYEITAGLYDPEGGKRYPLLGDEEGSTRYRLGKLIVERDGDKIKSVRLVKHEPAPELPPRTNVAKTPIPFGPATTEGAFRCEVRDKTITLTSLPDSDPFTITLALDKLMKGPAQVRSIHAVGMDGAQIRQVSFDGKENSARFQIQPNEFAYQLRLE